ncbi:hypothetical protein [Paenibacillus sp. S-12]|uniref:hypothetical protein n=1 Tax=Paenibacillus sp. S-12 TaxID=3031371 RepID=UPI0025A2153F|nr:hypothetical protein [Paenibacillus sp. S-12]
MFNNGLPFLIVTMLLLFYALIAVGVILLIFKRSKRPNLLSALFLLAVAVVSTGFLGFLLFSNKNLPFDITIIGNLILMVIIAFTVFKNRK